MTDIDTTNKEKNITLAFFDILGTSDKIKDDQYKKVYDFYSYMVDLCSQEQIPLSFSKLPGHSEGNADIVIDYSMKHAFFSDTFIIWIEYQTLFGMSLRGFYEKCMDIFVEAIKRGIPLRGAIARGSAIMDEKRKIFLGKPIVEAARAESAQNWLGIGLTKTCKKVTVSEAWLLLPYEKHIKDKYANKGEKLFTNCVLDWPKYWRNTQNEDVIALIEKMNDNQAYYSYYDNTIAFIKYSEMNNNYWEDKLPPTPPLKPLLVLRPKKR